MPGDPHPIDVVLVDDVRVEKGNWREYIKERTALAVADATFVNNTDLTGQSGGLLLSAQFYRLDTSDTTTPDDGVNVLVDAAGNRFKKLAVTVSETQRKVTAAGAVTVSADDDDIIVVAKTVGAATNVNLPSAADRTKPVKVVDGKGDAATNNLTVIPQSGESIMATVNYHYIIDSNGGSIKLTPLADGSGWIV